jgi:hypothetical protein
LLWVAPLCFVVGILVQLNTRGNALLLGFLIGAALLIVYSITLKEVLEIASSGAVIRISTKEMGFQSVKELIDRIEEAKNARYLLLESS